MSEFKLTQTQQGAQEALAGYATHGMLYGGSRSGKTFLHVRNVILRGLKASYSRHAILRYRFNHIKASIILDTFPKVMRIAYPGVAYDINKTDWFAKLPNGSEVWFGGLDDKERTEKILGQEYATMYLNECSQIPKQSRDMAVTRLAQLCKIDGQDAYLKPRMFYDCNPTNKLHWSYKMFIQKIDPETKISLPDPNDYISVQMNPEGNIENLNPDYLKTLQSLTPRLRKRFLLGEFADATPNALFTDECIDTWRVIDGVLPDMVRVVVGVDPSGAGDSDNADNDAIGIIVAGLGTDGNAYVIEDLTVKAGPKTWGTVVTTAYDRHEANAVVGETNYGGEMVNFVIQTCRPRTPFKKVTASRGKHVRAEPFSSLYEQGRVRHVGAFNELEEEITHFTTTGFVGPDSPNRADALFWCLAELFPGVVKPKDVDTEEEGEEPMEAHSWMG